MALTTEQIEKIKKYIGAYAPSYLDDPNVDMFIEDCSNELSASYFGTKYIKAVAMLSMHNIAVAKQSSAGADGIITAKSIGPVTVKYAVTANATLLDTTKYGLLFKELRDSCGCGFGITNAWRNIT